MPGKARPGDVPAAGGAARHRRRRPAPACRGGRARSGSSTSSPTGSRTTGRSASGCSGSPASWSTSPRLSLGPTSTWGRAVLGSVAPATEESLEGASDLALGTDLVGSSGLQAAYEQQLAGTPGGSVSLVDARSGRGARACCGASRPSRASRCAPRCRTTSSRPVSRRWRGRQQDHRAGGGRRAYRRGAGRRQRARDHVVRHRAGGPVPAGLDVQGGVDGRADRRPGRTSTSRWRARAPRSSTASGSRTTSSRRCPPGSTFADAIAASCNTTVVDRAGELGDETCTTSAEQFGVGAEWDLPLPAYSGSVPRGRRRWSTGPPR